MLRRQFYPSTTKPEPVTLPKAQNPLQSTNQYRDPLTSKRIPLLLTVCSFLLLTALFPSTARCSRLSRDSTLIPRRFRKSPPRSLKMNSKFDEKGDLDGTQDEHTKLPILRHYHEDTYRMNFYITKNMMLKFDLFNRIDPTSMSSNFSSNVFNLKLPGVQGRNEKTELYFPDREFNPIKIESRHKELFILEGDMRTASFFRFEPEKGFIEIEWAIQEVLKAYPKMGCSNFMIRNQMVFFICFYLEQHRIERVDIKYDYKIVVLHMFKNKVLYIGTFADYYYKFPIIYVNDEPKGSGNYLIWLFNKPTTSETKGHFQPNSRTTILYLKASDDPNSNFEIKDMINRDLEQLLFGSISDSISFQKLNYYFSGKIEILFRRKFADYSIKKQLFGCKLDFNEEALSALKLTGCHMALKNDIVRYSFYKENSMYVDVHNILHFCQPKGGKTKNTDLNEVEYYCRKGNLGMGWEFVHFEVFKNVGLVIMSTGQKMIQSFLYYYDKDMFTWFSYKKTKVRARRLVVLDEKGFSRILKFHNHGVSTVRLDFDPFLSLDVSNLVNLDNKLLYLDGNPIFNIDVTFWNGESVVDNYRDEPNYVIVDKNTGYFFTRLGFHGSNLNFSQTGSSSIFKFRPMKLDLEKADPYHNTLAVENFFDEYNPRKIRVLFYSDHAQNFIFVYKKFMVISRYSFHMMEDRIMIDKCDRIDYDNNFELDLDRVDSMDTKGELIMFFLKKPYSLNALNMTRRSFHIFKMHEDFEDPNMGHCKYKLILIICIFKDPATRMDILRVYTIGARKVSPYHIANATIKSKFLDIMTIKHEGVLPTSLTLISFDANPYKNHNMMVFIGVEYKGINRYQGYELILSGTAQEMQDGAHDVTSWKELEYFNSNPKINKNSEIFFYGNMYLIKQAYPKFHLFMINRYSEIDLQYIDTNEILYQKNYSYMRINTFIYRNLEDDQVYFAVYNVTNKIERTFVRNEHFPEYNPMVKIDYVMLSPIILFILFYDSFTGEVLKAYTFFVNGPYLMAKTFKDIIIDHNRYPLETIEDKEMHYSYYLTVQTPEIMIFEDQEEKLSIKLDHYLDIKGNMINVDWIPDPLQDNSGRKLVVVEGVTLKKTRCVVKDSQLKNYMTEQKFAANGNFFAVNAKNRNTFTIFRSSSMIEVSEVVFDFGPGIDCDQAAISNRNIFCFYNIGFKSFVMIRNFQNLEVEPIVVHAFTIGINYQIMYDSDDATFMINLHKSKTSVEILKIDKINLLSQKNILGSREFGEYTLFVNSIVFFYNRADQNLVVLALNIMSNSLVFFTAFFDEETMELNMIRTIKNKLNLNDMERNFWDLRTNPRKNYVFNCLAITKDYMYEVRITQDFTAEVSPFKWDVKFLYRYFNVLFTEFIEHKSRIQYRFSNDNLFLILYNNKNAGIVNYRRFKSPYIHDYHAFGGDDSQVKRPLTSLILNDGKKIRILGLGNDDKDFMTSLYKSKMVKMKLNKPNLFIGSIQTIRITFWNNRQIDVNFQFTNASDLEQEKNKWASLLLWGLRGSLMLTSIAICLALICLFKLLKEGGHGVLERQADFQTQQEAVNDEEYMTEYMTKKTQKSEKGDESMSGEGSGVDAEPVPYDIARLRNNLIMKKKTLPTGSRRVGDILSGRTLAPSQVGR